MNKQIRTGVIRCGYVHIATPRMNDLSGKVEYSIQLLIPKDSKTAKEIEEMTDAIIHDKWGTKVPGSLRLPLRDADKEGKKEEHMKGMYFMNVRTEDAPGIVGPDGIGHPNPTECRSGDYFRVSIGGFAYDRPSNGVSFGLNNVQWVKKGDTLSGRKRAEDDFGPAPDLEEDELLG